jgi:enoyl-CoA hydratase/carnithine racemase
MAYDLSLVHVEVTGGIATATIDNPPINLMTLELFGQLAALTEQVEQDPDVRVLVVRSADPDFFIAHFDVELILQFPTSGPVERETEHNTFHQMCERLRTMPKATICVVAGRVGGGGSEFAASCDMRFGLLGKTVVNQMEVPIGILPGGTGTQRLPRLLGRGRALEVILGGADLDAATAERWGYLNRAFATADELDAHVAELAARIAGSPPTAVRAAKAAVLLAEPAFDEGLFAEAELFAAVLRTPEAAPAMRAFLAAGGQTREVELEVGELTRRLTVDRSASPDSKL